MLQPLLNHCPGALCKLLYNPAGLKGAIQQFGIKSWADNVDIFDMFDVLCETLRGTGFQWKVFDNIVSFDRELLTKLASGNPQVYISQIRHCFFIKSSFKGFQVLGRFSGKTQKFHQGIKNIVSFLPKTILSEAMSLTYLGGIVLEGLLT